jgi:2-polyprenyl-3-methyl-5-hydroxy-6-metoxy-1,4-benzoquinol methylase
MDAARHWNDFYKKPLSDIPWEISKPPDELIKLFKENIISGGKALDMACGTGNYSVYLAKKGFSVSGIDLSERAIKIARKRAESEKVKADFIVGNINELEDIFPQEYFDFILDYSLLHHLDNEAAKAHAANCLKVMRPGGKLLLVCYSENHKRANGKDAAEGKYKNIMYFRSVDEISKIYGGFEQLSYMKARLGKNGKHPAHAFVFKKR